jgi:hypothetical protein
MFDFNNIYDKVVGKHLENYKSTLDKIRELRLFKEDGVFKVHVKLEDDTEMISPLSNYKAIISTIMKSKNVKAKK